EPEVLPQLVFEIPQVRVVYQFRLVDEQDEGGRFDARLSAVVDPQALSFVRRRLKPHGRLVKHLVEPSRRDPQGVLVRNVMRQLEDPVNPLAGLGGEEEDRRVLEKAQLLTDLLFK